MALSPHHGLPGLAGGRMLHTMLRVRDLDRSLDFYIEKLGMRLLRRADYPAGRFTLVFVGYGKESDAHAIELTYNWDAQPYHHGTAYGHIALAVPDVHAACATLAAQGVRIRRAAGEMKYPPVPAGPRDIIAFVEDPDGYLLELIEERAGR